MTNQESGRKGGTPHKTLFEYAGEGVTFDGLPETLRKDVRVADKHKDERDALAEIRVDQLFAKAAGVICDLLDTSDEVDPEDPAAGHHLRLKAAAEVFKMRAVTLKANKKRQTAEAAAKKVHDGFVFGPSGNATEEDGAAGG